MFIRHLMWYNLYKKYNIRRNEEIIMTNEEKIAMLEDIMDLDEGTLEAASVLKEFEEWDSLSKLSLMAMAKKEFSKKLTTEEIHTFKTVQDICDYLQ